MRPWVDCDTWCKGWLVGYDKRARIDARVAELRQEAEAQGLEFQILEETRNRVVCQTRQPVPGYAWSKFSVRLVGDQVAVRDLSTPHRVGREAIPEPTVLQSSPRAPLRTWERRVLSVGVSLASLAVFAGTGGFIAYALTPDCSPPEVTDPFGLGAIATAFECLDRELGYLVVGVLLGALVGVAVAAWAVRRVRSLGR